MSKIGFSLIAIGISGLIAVQVISYKISTHIEHAKVFVQSKERLLHVSSNDGKTSSEFRNYVYGQSETYVVEDNLWMWHFTSSTVYAKIQEGQTCDVTLSGYRFGFLSMFQNIIAVECGK